MPTNVLILAVLTIGFVTWVIVRLRARLRGTLEEAASWPLKEPDALYRDGKVIARIEGATVDEAAKSVHFERLTGTVNLLNLGPDLFDFRRYRLRCIAIESMTGAPPAPYLYRKVTCNIVDQA